MFQFIFHLTFRNLFKLRWKSKCSFRGTFSFLKRVYETLCEILSKRSSGIRQLMHKIQISSHQISLKMLLPCCWEHSAVLPPAYGSRFPQDIDAFISLIPPKLSQWRLNHRFKSKELSQPFTVEDSLFCVAWMRKMTTLTRHDLHGSPWCWKWRRGRKVLGLLGNRHRLVCRRVG